MVLLMRYAGLRISDVVTLSGRVATACFGGTGASAPPIAAAKDNRRFFYSDTTCLRTLVKAAWRTLDAVFTRSGVAKAHPHRFRHTLASELLGKGGSIEKVAGILGDSPITVRRYYAKWTPEFQGLQDDLIRKVHGTELAQVPESASKC